MGCSENSKTRLDEGLLDSNEDNWSRLAQSYQLAREDEMAVDPYITAAELSEDGEMYSRLSSIYINLSQFEEAVDTLELAFDKGNLDRADQAYIRQARALLELNRHDEGLAAIRLAARDERSEDTAATWLRYLENEKTSMRQSKDNESCIKVSSAKHSIKQKNASTDAFFSVFEK